ncbi:MAG: hypothetical protein PHU52_02675 [Dehalococcoidales bacterium]|nr:hypothetical protein [Dehalococcoidales bacterium]
MWENGKETSLLPVSQLFTSINGSMPQTFSLPSRANMLKGL